MPSERLIFAQDGETILDLAMRAGVHINASCGGSGSCGKCRVKVLEGRVHSGPSQHLSTEDALAGFCLACSTTPGSDLVVEIPFASQVDRTVLERRAVNGPAITPVMCEGCAGSWVYDPPVRLFPLDLPAPSLDDSLADFERLARELEVRHGIEDLWTGLMVLKGLGATLRAADWKVDASLQADGRGYRLVHVERTRGNGRRYALAVDMGTTTVCGQLIDGPLFEGFTAHSSAPGALQRSVVAEYADYNSQISFGEDVISRIFYARKKGGLKRLQRALASTIAGVVEELLLQGATDASGVSHVVLAGNTTMMHLLLGIDPSTIMLEPYVPVAKVFPPAMASDLGMSLEPHTPAFFVPCVSSYVGGDIVAGVAGSGMARGEPVTLFMDLGTNGEIVVGNREWLLCASCSAGPAFEGGGIEFGMRAGAGAIEQVRINARTFEPMILTVGKARPMGICGSGLIDLVAELLEVRLIDERGRFRRDCPTDRVRRERGAAEYVICYAPETSIGKDIVITEIDIDNLLRAKAAMYAGCRVLARAVGLDISDVERVVLAGGFGHSIDIEKAQTIGLLPEVPVERFVFLGNGSLLGAAMCTLSLGFIDECSRVAKMMTNLELSASNDFMAEFTAAMFFPHTEARFFPNATVRLWDGRGCADGAKPSEG